MSPIRQGLNILLSICATEENVIIRYIYHIILPKSNGNNSDTSIGDPINDSGNTTLWSPSCVLILSITVFLLSISQEDQNTASFHSTLLQDILALEKTEVETSPTLSFQSVNFSYHLLSVGVINLRQLLLDVDLVQVPDQEMSQGPSSQSNAYAKDTIPTLAPSVASYWIHFLTACLTLDILSALLSLLVILPDTSRTKTTLATSCLTTLNVVGVEMVTRDEL